MVENKRKYLLDEIPKEKIDQLKKNAKKVGIIQWYMDEEAVERIRLTISYDKIIGHTHFWEEVIKKSTNDPQESIEEKTLDPRENVNLKDLENKRSITKIRYIIKKNPEIFLDVFLKLENSNTLKIKDKEECYLEIKARDAEIDFEKELKDIGLENVKDVTPTAEHKNKNKAKMIDPELKPLKMIDYVQNKLIGSVTVVLTQGNNKKTKEDFKRLIEKIKTDGKYEEEFTPETDALYLFIKSGFEVEKAHFLVFPPFINGNDYPENYELLKKVVTESFELECDYSPINYDPSDKSSAYKSLEEIFDAVSNIISENEKIKRTTLIELTGGHKYPGIELAIYSLFNKKAFYYKQKNSTDNQNMVQLKFPPLPVGWNNEIVDDYFPYFKLLFQKVEDGKTLNYNIFTILPEFLKELFSISEDGSLITVPLIKEIKNKYESSRKMPFGHGEHFISLIQNEKMEAFLNEKIPLWSLKWMGDLIPETVEHSQRHSKRLMEFGFSLIRVIEEENFLNGIDPTLRKEFYLILAVAMNVHDLGHTVLNYKTDDSINLCIDGLPSLVRDLHSELSYQLLENGDLLDGMEKIDNDKNKIEKLKKAIMYVSKYHRQYLPISKTEKNEETEEKFFAKNLRMKIKSLEERLNEDASFQNEQNWKEMIMLAARWLKFIDSTDVQSDRTIMEEYTEIRIKRTKEEIKSLSCDLLANPSAISSFDVSYEINNILRDLCDKNWSKLDETAKQIEEIVYKDVNRNLEDAIQNGKTSIFVDEYLKKIDRIAFKSRQFLHFQKHQMVKSIVPEFYDPKDGRLHLKIYSESNANESDANKIIENVKKDIKTEFVNSNLSLFNKKVLKLCIEV